jgi:hypothetical protein
MTSVKIFAARSLLIVVLALVGTGIPSTASAAPAAAAPSGAVGTSGVSVPATGLPTPVCTPSWGSLVLPICA